MTLSLHVQSRGRAPEHDYRWVVVEPGLHPPRRERPPRLDARAAALVQSDTPSLLLARVGGEPLLFLTALGSSRVDVQGRPIRTAIALTGPREGLLRGLAAKALREDGREALTRTVDAAVTDSGDGGFDVDASLLSLLEQDALPEAPPAPLGRRYAPNEPDERERLADEIASVGLPPGEGALVVVTGALAAERLEASGAWRGLSRLVSAPMEPPPPEVRPGKKGVAARRLLLTVATAAAVLILASLLPPRP